MSTTDKTKIPEAAAAPETAAVAPAVEATTTTPSQDDQEQPTQGREAARYRTRLRETEAERDEAAAALDAQRQRSIADTLLMGIELPPPAERPALRRTVLLHDVDDLARFTGRPAADYLDDAGAIEPAKVTAAAIALQAERPYLFRDAGPAGRNHVPREGNHTTPPVDPMSGFIGAFGPSSQ